MNAYEPKLKSKRRLNKIRRRKNQLGLKRSKLLIDSLSFAPIPDIEPKWDSHYDLSGVEYVSYGVLEADLVEEKE